MPEERIELGGVVSVRLIRDGKVIRSETAHNVTCNTGIAKLAAVVGGLSSVAWNYIAVGTGTVTPAATDATLTAEVARVHGGVIQVTTNTANDTAQIVTGFTFSSSVVVAEAGLFDTPGVNSGDMLGRVLIGPYSIIPGDQLTVQWMEVL